MAKDWYKVEKGNRVFPGRTTITRNMEKIYEEEKKKVIEALDKVEFVALRHPVLHTSSSFQPI